MRLDQHGLEAACKAYAKRWMPSDSSEFTQQALAQVRYIIEAYVSAAKLDASTSSEPSTVAPADSPRSGTVIRKDTEAPAPIHDPETADLVRRLNALADGIEVISGDRRSIRRGVEKLIREAIAALTASNDRVAELERENFTLAANQCDGPKQGDEHGHEYCPIVEKLTRERDEALLAAAASDDFAKEWHGHCQAAEATVARLTEALEKISASASAEAPSTDEYEAMSNWDGVFHEGISAGLYRSATVARAALPTEQLHEKIAEAEEKGNRCLADANAASERGDKNKAERLYEKGQYWLDRANELRGWG